jgi:hypothetical protein
VGDRKPLTVDRPAGLLRIVVVPKMVSSQKSVAEAVQSGVFGFVNATQENTLTTQNFH